MGLGRHQLSSTCMVAVGGTYILASAARSNEKSHANLAAVAMRSTCIQSRRIRNRVMSLGGAYLSGCRNL